MNGGAAVEDVLPTLRHMVKSVPARADFDRDDALQEAVIGVIEALPRFDPVKGSLHGFALRRARGAVSDAQRELDQMSRTTRRTNRALRAARDDLRQANGSEPTRAEVAAEAGIELRTAEKHRNLYREWTPLSIEQPIAACDGDKRLTDTMPDRGPALDAGLLATEASEAVHAAIDRLTEQQRYVIDRYYFGGLTLTEIGAEMGVTESRVCQIHTGAKRHLRSILAGQAA